MTQELATQADAAMIEQVARVCRKCGLSYPATAEYFNRHPHCVDGLLHTCKECTRSYGRDHYHEDPSKIQQYVAGHRDEINENARRYWSEHRDKKSENAKAYRQRHPDLVKQRNRERYLKDPQKVIAYSKEWYRLHPDKMASRIFAKNARRRGAPLDDEAKRYVEMIRHDPCVYCGSREGIEIDHIVALASGGNSAWDNLAPVCRPCNIGKHMKTALHYIGGGGMQ